MSDVVSPGVSLKRPPILERNSTWWCVALLIAVLFSITNLPWHLDDYDQAKQAFTSFEMVNGGHWLYQHTPNEKVATKPPLVGWESAVIYGLTRSWEIAWRLPSLAAAIALLIVLTRAASNAYGATAGLVTMGAFGLNLLSPRLATLVRTDMPLALVVFLLGLNIWRKIRDQTPWQTRDRLIMFVLLTGAMLIKGPIVYAFLLPGIVGFQWWKRGSGAGVKAWCGWWPWIASLAVFLAWTAAGIAWVPGFYEQVVLREFAGRFGETAHRPQPIYFYFPHLIHKFAPWSILLIALAVVALRNGHEGKSSGRSRGVGALRPLPQFSPEIVWLICWSVGGLIVMSLIPSKRVDRIFPVVPPLCLLLAGKFAWLTQAADLATRARRWSTAALIFACFFTSAYALQKIITSYRADDAALARFGATVRRQAETNGWQYEVIGGKEEGLLLYLRRMRFIKPAEAAERWKAGTLDAVVAPAEEVSRLMGGMPGLASSGAEASVTVNEQVRRYVLLARRASP